MYSLIYFSPTGNTKYLAKQLAEDLLIGENHVYQLDKVKYDDLSKDDHLIFMYPIHGFNPPRTVKRFVKEFKKGKFSKVSLIAVGCNNLWLNDNVSSGLVKSFNKLDIEVVVDEIIAMPLTFVMDFSDEVKKKTITEAKTIMRKIVNKIEDNQVSKREIKLKSKMISLIGKLEDPAARLFGLELHANKDCTSCSICWNNCPENNIKESQKNKPKFGFSCSMCMRCIYDCPTKAISPYISKFLTIKNGYTIE